MKNKVWILFGRGEGDCKGIYTSIEELKKGVDYYIALDSTETLSYQEWEPNYPAEPNSWEWCYIAPGSNPHDLASGGGSVPKRKFWGKNLVGVIWTPMPEWAAGYA